MLIAIFFTPVLYKLMNPMPINPKTKLTNLKPVKTIRPNPIWLMGVDLGCSI